MKFEQDERIIKEHLGKVRTPEYDIQLALADRIRHPRRFAGKSVLILAAVMIGIFGLIGAGTYYEWKSFGFDGSVSDGSAAPTDTSLSEDTEFSSTVTQELSLDPSELQPGEVLIVTHLQDGSQSSANAACGVFRTDSEQALQDMLVLCSIPYAIPTQLPDGYQKNIQDIYVGYVNSSGEFIRMTISLAAASWNVSFGAPDTAYSEKLNLDGYNQALLICDESRKNGSYYSLAMNSDIPVVTAVNLMDLGQMERNAAAGIEGNREPFEETYDQLAYYIESSAIEKEELLRFVDGLQRP